MMLYDPIGYFQKMFKMFAAVFQNGSLKTTFLDSFLEIPQMIVHMTIFLYLL